MPTYLRVLVPQSLTSSAYVEAPRFCTAGQGYGRKARHPKADDERAGIRLMYVMQKQKVRAGSQTFRRRPLEHKSEVEELHQLHFKDSKTKVPLVKAEIPDKC